MRVAVVGGSGFVGRHVAACLCDGGADVITVDGRAPASSYAGETVVLAKLEDELAVTRAASACGHVDALVWLAATIASPSVADARAVDGFTVMAEAPIRFLDALVELPTLVVSASSIEVYGAPETLPVSEAHPTNPSGVYGAAKLAAEHFLRISLRDTRTSLARLRLAFIYGPGQHAENAIPRFIAGLRRGEPPTLRGGGSDIRDDIFVGDVARAVRHCIDARAQGAFNIATGRPHTLREVAETACEISGTGLRPVTGDEPSAWVDRWYDASLARDVLGFEAQTSLVDGLRAMWDDASTS